MQKVITYIDGFNLYFGLLSKYKRKYIWLNIEDLSNSLLKTNQEVIRVNYFTSLIKNNPSKEKRQNTYLAALKTLAITKIYYGQYLINSHTCPTCGNIEKIPSEKMTDVNIATRMLVDAYENQYDVAILISGDSDLSGTIAEIRRLFPNKKIVTALPPNRSSFHLQKVSNAYFVIGRRKFEISQFPKSIILHDGSVITRPLSWI